MKNVKTLFSKGFRAAIIVVVFGLVLGFSSIPATKANAQQGNAPAAQMNVSPSTINRGDTAILSWSSVNATHISITPGVGSNLPSSGERPVSPNETTTYRITVSNDSGDSATGTVTLNVRTVQPSNITVNLTASDNSINSGESTTLIWTTTGNPSSCTASGAWSGSKSPNGGSEPTGSLYSTRTYTINCVNNIGNSVFDTVIVNVGTDNNNGNRPDVTTKSATDIEENEATLRGEVDGNGLSTRVWFEYSRDRDEVEDCRTDRDCEETDEQSTGSGSRNFDEDIDGLRANTKYYFRAVARNSEGTDYGSILSFTTDDDNVSGTCLNTSAINYRGSLPCRYATNNTQPSVLIYADSTNIAYGGTTFVRWNTVNATSCFASGGSTGWAGVKSIGPGSFYTGSLTSSRTYTITCSNASGSSTDSVTVNVRGRTTVTPASSLVLITSSIDRNQPILPTLDNTRPRVGDEINYTVTYQNIGTGSITNLVLRLDLPYEVDYMFSNPSNPVRSGNTLIFNLGTLRANGEGTVSVRVRVRENAAPGAFLNFPAVLSYIDPSGFSQSVSANVSAQVWNGPTILIDDEKVVVPLGANIFGAGFWPTSLFGWLLFIILILVLILLARSVFAGASAPWSKKTVTTIQH